MTEKVDLLICVTAMAILRTVFSLLPHLLSSLRFESLPTHNKWHVWDRNLSMFFYIVVETLFLVFVVWGFEFLSTEFSSMVSDNVAILWLCVLFASNATLFVSCCCIVKHYRLLTSTFRSMDFVCTLAFLIDNFTNSRHHLVTILIGLKLFCQVFFVTDMHIYIPVINAQQKHVILKEEDETKRKFDIQYLDDDELDESLREKADNLFKTIAAVDPYAMNLDELREFISKSLKQANAITSISDIEKASCPELSGSSMETSSSGDKKSKTK